MVSALFLATVVTTTVLLSRMAVLIVQLAVLHAGVLQSWAQVILPMTSSSE